MPEKQVSLTLTFATEGEPAPLAARVIEIVVAEVAANLVGAYWHGFEIDDEPEPEAECAHTSWEELPFRLVDGTPVASRKCSDCGTDLPTILLDGRKTLAEAWLQRLWNAHGWPEDHVLEDMVAAQREEPSADA